MSKYIPIYNPPENLERYVSGIEISESAEQAIEKVLGESELDHPVPGLGSFSSPDDSSKNEYKFYIFELSELGRVVDALGTAPNYISKIGNHDYVLIQAHKLEKANVTKIDYCDDNFVFE